MVNAAMTADVFRVNGAMPERLCLSRKTIPGTKKKEGRGYVLYQATVTLTLVHGRVIYATALRTATFRECVVRA